MLDTINKMRHLGAQENDAMGQYFVTANLDKREFINSHKLGDGYKFLEQQGWLPGGTNDALHYLLGVHTGLPEAGRWAGDRIAVIGSAVEDEELRSVYCLCRDPRDGDLPEGHFKDITDELISHLEQAFEVVYFGESWMRRKPLREILAGLEFTHLKGDSRVTRVHGRDFRTDALITAIKRMKISPDTKFPIEVERLEVAAERR